jgi:hypothetical protein
MGITSTNGFLHKTTTTLVGIEVLAAVVIIAVIFRAIAPRRIGLVTCCTLVTCSANFGPRRWKCYVPSKRQFTYVLSQMTTTFKKHPVMWRIYRTSSLSTLKMEVLRSFETSIHICTIPDDDNLQETPSYVTDIQNKLTVNPVDGSVTFLRNVNSHTYYPR